MKTHDWPKALDARIQQALKLHGVSAEHRAAVAVGFILKFIERETA